MRHRVVRSRWGRVVCDECGSAFSDSRCPTCEQRRRWGGGLEDTVDTSAGGEYLWITVVRSDEGDGISWYDGDGPPDGEPVRRPW